MAYRVPKSIVLDNAKVFMSKKLLLDGGLRELIVCCTVPGVHL
jgi:hypothetical protein